MKIHIDKYIRKGYTYQRIAKADAGIAQLVERFTRNEEVVGSSPISSFFYCTFLLHKTFSRIKKSLYFQGFF